MLHQLTTFVSNHFSMPNNHIQNIRLLLIINGYPNKSQIIPLPTSGSNRLYFRVIFTENHNPKSILASFNNDINENIAHNSFSIHFKSLGFNVPDIYARDESYQYFLLQDLGDITLFNLLMEKRSIALDYYKQAITNLVQFQTTGIKNLDLDVAYPIKSFNRRSVMWDLNYFKYYFIKPHDIIFNEDLLENDFIKLTDKLLQSKCEFFNYRDFQSRNIMIYEDKPWFIDFQGGRKGPLQYDLVSLLYQVKAGLTNSEREILYNFYIAELNRVLPTEQLNFESYYNYFIYFRLMQVMGAYGFRGMVQRKAHFLQSIVPAIKLLEQLINSKPIDTDLSELHEVFNQIKEIDLYNTPIINNRLNISVNSFSYKKKGIPLDTSGNGGGHVFDCRSLPNPGRIAELRDYTGLDSQIISYLEEKEEMMNFIKNTKLIIDQSIQNYIERKFNSLQINFGCTGGRHRSVYSASQIGKYIKSKYPTSVVNINHKEL